MSAAYEKRESIMEREPRRWRIEPGALVREGGLSIPWREVTEVRLRYAPTSLKTWRYLLTVRGAGGEIAFDNGHYLGVGDFEDRSDTFSPFVAAVLSRVEAEAPRARFYSGATVLGYLSLAVPLAFGVWLLAVVLWNLPVQADAGGGRILERLFVVAVMLPLAGVWAVKSWPRQATPQSLRESLPSRSTP